jgi:hypothetical protein
MANVVGFLVTTADFYTGFRARFRSLSCWTSRCLNQSSAGYVGERLTDWPFRGRLTFADAWMELMSLSTPGNYYRAGSSHRAAVRPSVEACLQLHT